MGLDTTHDCWYGAYSAFGRWRACLASTAGYKVVEWEPHAVLPGWTLRRVELPWEMFRAENAQGDWSSGPPVEDPLLYLLVHSDIEGVIHPEEGRHLAARLEQMLPDLDDSGGGPQIRSMTEVTQRFIDGLHRAAKAGEDVRFF